MQFRPSVIRHPVAAPMAASDCPSVMGFSLAKAGSTLLYDALAKLAQSAQLTYFSIEDKLFADNVSPTRRPTAIGNPFEPTGFCYGGFRQFPAFPIPILHSSRVVFLVRDPRDMVVSLYFSLMRSHVIPDAGSGGTADAEMLATRSLVQRVDIDKYAVASTTDYVRMFEGYVAQGFHWRPNVAIYRYEDIIFDKDAWLRDMCAWFDWTIAPDMIARVVSEVDVRVDGERPDRHIRQVTPGNYRKHLRPDTVEYIEKTLGEYMRLFGYL